MRCALVLLPLLAGAALAAVTPPVVIAHRGASGYLPEHTLSATAMAHAQGADYIEQDLVLSKDGVPLVLHDIEIDTVTDVARRFPGRSRANGRFYAIDFTLAEIRQLRVMERFDPETGRPVYPTRFPAGPTALAVATLEEALELIAGLNRSTGRRVGIYPEIKSPGWHRREGQDISAIVLAVLARHGFSTKADPCFLQCFEFEEVKRLRTELGYRGRLVQLIGRYGGSEVDERGALLGPHDNTALLSREGLAEIARYADGVGPEMNLLFRRGPDGLVRANERVAEAHRAGLVVHPYTFRADALPAIAASGDELLGLLFRQARVDGVFTDHPDLVVAFLRGAAPAVK